MIEETELLIFPGGYKNTCKFQQDKNTCINKDVRNDSFVTAQRILLTVCYCVGIPRSKMQSR